MTIPRPVVTFSLQSGSNGNSIYVEAGGIRLLFDAGLSGRTAKARAASHGRDLRGCDGLIVSHDHSDHVRGAGVFHRQFAVPVYISERVYRAVRIRLGPLRDVRRYRPGDVLVFGNVRVHTLRTPHDGVDTVCFVVEHEGRSLGIFTDLGHPFAALSEALGAVDAAYLECNYDIGLLETGPYPRSLKRRIAGDGGHLSNDDAADLARRSINGRLKWLAAAHLSQENNRPSLALSALRNGVGRLLAVHHASRQEAGELLEV